MAKEAKEGSSLDKSAEVSYIVTFYTEVQLLMHNYAEYKNLVKEITVKYGFKGDEDLSESKVNPQERQVIINAISACNSSIEKTYIQYCTLVEVMKSKVKRDEKVDKLYAELEKVYMLKVNDLRDYVIRLNLFVGNNIIQDILRTMVDRTEELYGQ